MFARRTRPYLTDVEGSAICIRVFVIEDDDRARSAVIASLEEGAGCALYGAATGYDDGLAGIAAGGFDVALIDLDLAGRPGVDLIAACAEKGAAKALVLSVLGDERAVVDAIAAGADGYILKDRSFSDLPEAVAQAMRGEAPISPAAARHLLRQFRPAAEPAVALTRRERQMLEELARGASYKEVAATLGLSVHTVGDYAKSLYRKLSVTSRGAAVRKAVRARLIRL